MNQTQTPVNNYLTKGSRIPRFIYSFWPFFFLLACTIAVLYYAVTVALTGWPSTAYSVGEISRYCEIGHHGPMREPINTVSNFAMIVSGFFVLWLGGRDRYKNRALRNPMTGLGPQSLTFAVSMIGVGICSAWFHASHTDLAGKGDSITMLMAMGFPLVYNISRMARWSDRGFFVAFLSLNLITTYIFIVDDSYSVPIANGVVLVSIISELLIVFPKLRHPFSKMPVRRKHDGYYWVGLFGVGILARVFWNLSRKNEIWCDPQSIFQGHAAWHILIALAITFYYLDCRTEREGTYL